MLQCEIQIIIMFEALGIVDVSDPSRPELVRKMSELKHISAATIYEDNLFLSSVKSSILDVSKPDSPFVLKKLNYVYQMDNIIVDKKRIYALNRWYLGIIDVSDLDNPTTIFFDKTTQAVDFVLVDDYLYIVDMRDGLLVYKINRNTPAWRNTMADFLYKIEFWRQYIIDNFLP